MERSLGVAVLGLVTGEVPDDQTLVSACGEEHVGAVTPSVVGTIGKASMSFLCHILLHGSGQAGDPAILLIVRNAPNTTHCVAHSKAIIVFNVRGP